MKKQSHYQMPSRDSSYLKQQPYQYPASSGRHRVLNEAFHSAPRGEYSCDYVDNSHPINLKNKRNRSQHKQSTFERCEQLRFQSCLFEQKLQTLQQQLSSVQPQGQQVTLPLEVVQSWLQTSTALESEFKQINQSWNSFFDDQTEDARRYRDKSKTYKKKLRGLENQSILFMKDQKDLEKSLLDITREHHHTKNQMEQDLEHFETKVSMLKQTKNKINFEKQIDHAVQELYRFYHNLENVEDDGLLDTSSFDKLFSFKPTQMIEEQMRDIKLKGQISEAAKQNISIPPLPMDKIQQDGQGQEISEMLKADSFPEEQEMPLQVPQSQEMVELVQAESSGNNKASSSRQPQMTQTDKDQIITNPVLIGAMQMTSKFDNRLEDKDANITLDMNTERLKQFPDEYDMLQSVEDPDQRILLKQVVFMKYEKQLKKQLKKEKKRRKQLKKQEQQKKEEAKFTPEKGIKQVPHTSKHKDLPPTVGVRSLVPTPTNQHNCSSRGSLQKRLNQQLSSASSLNDGIRNKAKVNQNCLGMNERNDDNEYTGIVTSRFSLHSELPSIDTQDLMSAQKKYQPQDVNKSELLNVEEELVLGLKSATQQSLVRKYEEEFRQKEIVRLQNKQNEKKLALSSSASRQSQDGRVESQETMKSNDLTRYQYASNNSNKNPPIYIAADLTDYSLQSDMKCLQSQNHNKLLIKNNSQSSNNVQILSVEGNLDSRIPSIPMNEIDQSSIQFRSKNSHDSCKPTNSSGNKLPEIDQINESFLSGVASQYRKILNKEGESERILMPDANSPALSPIPAPNSCVQPSMLQSELSQSNEGDRPSTSGRQSSKIGGASTSRVINASDKTRQPAINNFMTEQKNKVFPIEGMAAQSFQNEPLMIIESNNGSYSQRQPTQYQEQECDMKYLRKELPLDIIHERQSEFSQSMMTNAKGINTHRSKVSKQSHRVNNHYQNSLGGKNVSYAAGNTKNSITGVSGQTVGGTGSALPSGRSDPHYTNLDSAQRLPKGGSTGNQKLGMSGEQSNYNNIQRISMVSEMEDLRAQCSQQKKSLDQDAFHHQSLQPIDISAEVNSRNVKQKNSKSQKHADQQQLIQIMQQPSLGKLECIERQKILKNFDQDAQIPIQPPQSQRHLSHQNSLKKLKKNQAEKQRPVYIPPLGKSKSNSILLETKLKGNDVNYFNGHEHHRRNNIVGNNVNLTELNTEREMVEKGICPHSQRSHVEREREQRNRSYFDEESTPVIFENVGSELQSIDYRSKLAIREDESNGFVSRKRNSGIQNSSVQSQVYAEVDSMSRKSRMSQMLKMSPNNRISNKNQDSSQNQQSGVGSVDMMQHLQISIPQSSTILSPNNHNSTSPRIEDTPSHPMQCVVQPQFHPDVSKGTVKYDDIASNDSNPHFDMDNMLELDKSIQVANRDGKLINMISEKEEQKVKEEPANPKLEQPLNFMMIRSQSETQFRDKEFYEMCDDEDEIAMYCKFAEQNILDAIHVSHARNFSQLYRPPANINQGGSMQQVDSEATPVVDNMNKSSSYNNQLIFMSQRTFQKIWGRFLQEKTGTQTRTMGGDSGANAQESSATAVMNVENYATNTQNQTRGKATLRKFNDPTLRRLLGTSINQPNGVNPQTLGGQCLGTNLFTRDMISLNDGTLKQIMMPTHQYNRRTLLMMQNLHNNYFYSANSGILFTMQRGFNSGGMLARSTTRGAGIGQSFKNLTNLEKLPRDLLTKNASTGGVETGMINNLRTTAGLSNTNIGGDQEGEAGGKQTGKNQSNVEMNSLGGDPVNISSLLLGAKQQTDRINVGSITIVDDDGKFMIDRKLLAEANNSNQCHGRRLFTQSRNINGQVTTSDLSNLQTKQIAMLPPKDKDYIDEVGQPNPKRASQSSLLLSDSSQAATKKASIKGQSYLTTNKTSERMKNLFSGLKSIQQQKCSKEIAEKSANLNSDQTIADRRKTTSDLEIQRGIRQTIPLSKNYLTTHQDSRESNIQSEPSILTITEKQENDYDGTKQTLGQAKRSIPGVPKASLHNLRQMILQQQKNSMNLSSSLNLNNSLSNGNTSMNLQNNTSQYSGQTIKISDANRKKITSNLLKLKCKSQPKKTADNAHRVQKPMAPTHSVERNDDMHISSQVSFKPLAGNCVNQGQQLSQSNSQSHLKPQMSARQSSKPLQAKQNNININKKNQLSMKRSSAGQGILNKNQIKQMQMLQGKQDQFNTIGGADAGFSLAQFSQGFNSASKAGNSKQAHSSSLQKKMKQPVLQGSSVSQASFLVKKSSLIPNLPTAQLQHASSKMCSGRKSSRQSASSLAK